MVAYTKTIIEAARRFKQVFGIQLVDNVLCAGDGAILNVYNEGIVRRKVHNRQYSASYTFLAYWALYGKEPEHKVSIDINAPVLAENFRPWSKQSTAKHQITPKLVGKLRKSYSEGATLLMLKKSTGITIYAIRKMLSYDDPLWEGADEIHPKISLRPNTKTSTTERLKRIRKDGPTRVVCESNNYARRNAAPLPPRQNPDYPPLEIPMTRAALSGTRTPLQKEKRVTGAAVVEMFRQQLQAFYDEEG